MARPWVPISSLLTHMVDLLPFWSYLAGSKSVTARPSVRSSVRRSDNDTMTNTALEAALRRAAKTDVVVFHFI